MDQPRGPATVGPPTPTMCDMADEMEIPKLIEELVRLEKLSGVERLVSARRLVAIARASLMAAGDRGAWEATRGPGGLTYEQVLERVPDLGPNSRSKIVDAVVRENNRRAGRKADG